jgi:potassium-transporting ATPase potassium-binding subunit
MLMGRFIYVIPLMAVAGSLAQKKRLAPSAGSVPTHSPQFVGLLVGVVLIIGGLTYFPAVSLGPVTEQVIIDPPLSELRPDAVAHFRTFVPAP